MRYVMVCKNDEVRKCLLYGIRRKKAVSNEKNHPPMQCFYNNLRI